MAKPTNKSQTKITRIKASDDSPRKPKKVVKSSKENIKPKNVEASSDEKPKRRNIFKSIIGYFKGSWQELSQVRWPDRAATWKMTGALIAFTLFFVLLILLLDVSFKFLSEYAIRR